MGLNIKILTNFFSRPLKDESIHSIQITGNFDNWSRSLPTIKSTKEYLQEIKLESRQDVVFKFIINDDQWIVNDQFKVTHDEHGNSNNIIYADELVEEVDKENKANTGATSESKDKENAPESSLSETTVALKPEAKSASKPIALKNDNDANDLPEPTIQKEQPKSTEQHESLEAIGIEDHESFVEPVVSLKSPSKSIITEDDIISDIDSHGDNVPKKSGDLPQPSSTQQTLNQVLTPSSSFAAVSSPPVSSDYEHLDTKHEDQETEYNTAANSGVSTDTQGNEIVSTFQENKPVKPVLLPHDSESTLEITGSETNTNNNNSARIPGHYPSSPEHKSSSTASLQSGNNAGENDSQYTGKRESLISRLRNLFR